MPELGKRKMERFSLELPARISITGKAKVEEPESFECITSDISAGGAFFHTDKLLPVGTEMHVDLVLPLDELKKIKGKRARIKVKGAVVRMGEKGMAICFDEEYKISPMPD